MPVKDVPFNILHMRHILLTTDRPAPADPPSCRPSERTAADISSEDVSLLSTIAAGLEGRKDTAAFRQDILFTHQFELRRRRHT